MPKETTEILERTKFLERIEDLERRVVHLEQTALEVKSSHGDFDGYSGESRKLGQELMALKDRFMEQFLEGKPRPANRLEYVKIYSLRRSPDFRYGFFGHNSPGDFDRLLAADEEEIAKIASSLANPIRVKIVKALLQGPKTAAEIGGATGLTGGPLYHHLRTLAQGGFLATDDRKVYSLSARGLNFTIEYLVDGTGACWTNPQERVVGDVMEEEDRQDKEP